LTPERMRDAAQLLGEFGNGKMANELMAHAERGETKTLNDYARECHQANIKWWLDPETQLPINRNFGELIALCHSELSEALEGRRKNLRDKHLPHRASAEVELADCLIRIFDLADAFGYDLEGAYQEKSRYNAQRRDHTHEYRRTAADGKKF
jgi:NTP pyrophosphatase (non-canonical NTP hydrolase)